MKYTMIRLAIAILLGVVVGNSANAGFGSAGAGYGSYGAGYGSSGGAGYGSYGAGYGSSGGAGYGSYGAGYGSSGGVSYSGYGSSGGYSAAYGSSGGGSSGGAAPRQGLLSRLHTRVHSHMAAKHARHSAAYGSSGGGSSGGYVGYGSSGGYYAGGSSGGSSGSYYSGYTTIGGGSSGGVSYGSTGSAGYGSTGSTMGYGSTGAGYGSAGSSMVPAPYYGTSTASPSRTSALVSNSRSDDSVKLNVSVPESAKVYVNDRLTTSTGETRQFVSRGLESGRSYRFEIRAEMDDNGKIVTDTQSVVVTAGSQENVRFAMKATPKADAKVDTAVVLNVPENAEVTLAGNETQVKGATRVFKTSQLKAGDVWDDYVIQVKVGEQIKTQSIRLIAGDKLELSFDFDNGANRLAAN